MHAIVAVVIRLLAFIGKELTETLRRPSAIVSLVLGPFLIMAVFVFEFNIYSFFFFKILENSNMSGFGG